MIFGLDLGTTTGWALHDGRDVVRSGVWLLPAAAPSRAYAELLARMTAELDHPVGSPERPVLVAYEAVPAAAHGPGGDAAHRWGGFEAVVLAACEAHRVRFLGVGIAAVKRAAGLRSHASKGEVLAAARVRWPGVRFATHDEADARFVAVAAAAREGAKPQR